MDEGLVERGQRLLEENFLLPDAGCVGPANPIRPAASSLREEWDCDGMAGVFVWGKGVQTASRWSKKRCLPLSPDLASLWPLGSVSHSSRLAQQGAVQKM